MPESISNPVFFADPSRELAEHFKRVLGREWVMENWSVPHRIGLMQGLGWRIPTGAAQDGLMYARIWKQQGVSAPLYRGQEGLWTLEAGKMDPRCARYPAEDEVHFVDWLHMAAESLQLTRRETDIPKAQLCDRYLGLVNTDHVYATANSN